MSKCDCKNNKPFMFAYSVEEEGELSIRGPWMVLAENAEKARDEAIKLIVLDHEIAFEEVYVRPFL